uniref:ORF2 n=1 Tax=Piper yellow mottle virus TaxID=262957 RepID=A0A076U3Q4_9VIRU|nr:ORF2 [Piper yellow mottle virus]
MSYINTSSTSAYTEALKATEQIEEPAHRFVKPRDHNREGIQKSVTAVTKQNNTLIQLMVDLHERINTLEEKIERLRKEPLQSSGISADLVTKLENLTLREREKRPKEPRGKRLVFRDPLEIIKEERRKLNGPGSSKNSGGGPNHSIQTEPEEDV